VANEGRNVWLVTRLVSPAFRTACLIGTVHMAAVLAYHLVGCRGMIGARNAAMAFAPLAVAVDITDLRRSTRPALEHRLAPAREHKLLILQISETAGMIRSYARNQYGVVERMTRHSGAIVSTKLPNRQQIPPAFYPGGGRLIRSAINRHRTTYTTAPQ
jgi:hypothetical protein